jgi:hypothetical protein
MALAFCPVASYIKHWEAKHVSMKGHAAAMAPMPQPSIDVLSSKHSVRRPLLNAFLCSSCQAPSGRMVRVEAGPASVESEGQSSHGTIEKHVGVLESTEGIKVPGIEPVVDASNLDKPAKRCSVCGNSKLLVDFEETVTSEDKRTDVCRACLAPNRARRVKGRELYHLELTPQEAWERAKICGVCNLRKELRDFHPRKDSKDGTRSECRSCKSKYEKAQPAVLPVDTPQQCYNCKEMKSAADYSLNSKMPTGLHTVCKLCDRKSRKERYLRLKQSKIYVQRHDKVCTSCGQLKLTSEFSISPLCFDGLGNLCRSCQSAHSSKRYYARKARGTRAGPPASE